MRACNQVICKWLLSCHLFSDKYTTGTTGSPTQNAGTGITSSPTQNAGTGRPTQNAGTGPTTGRPTQNAGTGPTTGRPTQNAGTGTRMIGGPRQNGGIPQGDKNDFHAQGKIWNLFKFLFIHFVYHFIQFFIDSRAYNIRGSIELLKRPSVRPSVRLSV